MKAFLILEDGTVFAGRSIGSAREVVSEIVFNTSMTGYLEVLTEPSYAGQAVAMTYPLIGNYGICYEDRESAKPWVDGFIVRELSRIPSNFRSETTIQNFLEAHDIPGIEGIDTRALTKILRQKGTMNGMLTTNEAFVLDDVLKTIKKYRVKDAVQRVTTKEKKLLAGNGKRKVAVIDYGMRASMAGSLLARGCEVMVYPSDTAADEILSEQPDGILLSDGPGDPKECIKAVEEIKKIYDSEIPVFAVGLGHQLLALATGADTYKLKYGHRGGNHPVKDLKTGKVYITHQNHGYAVNERSLDEKICKPSFVNVNDKTIEGLCYENKKIDTVQFYPSDSAGSLESGFLLDYFMEMMGGKL